MYFERTCLDVFMEIDNELKQKGGGGSLRNTPLSMYYGDVIPMSSGRHNYRSPETGAVDTVP